MWRGAAKSALNAIPAGPLSRPARAPTLNRSWRKRHIGNGGSGTPPEDHAPRDSIWGDPERDSATARHRGSIASRLAGRSCLSHHHHRRGLAADLFYRSVAGLAVLLPDRRGARAARSARCLFDSAALERLLSDRQPYCWRVRSIPRGLGLVDIAGGNNGSLFAGAIGADHACVDAGRVGQRVRPHRPCQRPPAQAPTIRKCVRCRGAIDYRAFLPRTLTLHAADMPKSGSQPAS